MTQANWITLAVAIAGVLHGPLIPLLIGKLTGNKAKQ